MIEKFEDYLGKLPLTRVVKGRIEEIYKMNLKIIDFEVQDIFVCESKNTEGNRNYTSLWLFGKEFCVECKDFLNSFDFDLTPISEKITYCEISPTNFDFENTTESSILKISFRFGFSMSGTLIATETNCLKALELYRKYIISNIKK